MEMKKYFIFNKYTNQLAPFSRNLKEGYLNKNNAINAIRASYSHVSQIYRSFDNYIKFFKIVEK